MRIFRFYIAQKRLFVALQRIGAFVTGTGRKKQAFMRNERRCMRQRPEGPPPVSRTAYNGFFHIGMPLADSMGEGPLGKRGAEHRKDDVMWRSGSQPRKRLL